MQWAREAPLLAPEKPILVALALRVDERGECWPRVSTLVTDMGMSDATVRRALKNLEKGGWIVVERRRRGMRQGSNLYRLSLSQ